MASNYRKSFNFKNGIQVDTDNFIVDSIGKVGIGTTIPRQFLDVYGNDSGAVQVQGQVKVTGLTTTTKLYSGIGTIDKLVGTFSSIGIGTFNQLRVGNSLLVDNLIGYAYTAWITNVNENGFSNLGLRTDTSVGIGSTTLADFNLLVGSDPRVEGVDGIGFKNGDIRATGIITAPTFVGNLTGIAASATILETGRTISISGDLIGEVVFDGSTNVSIASTLSSSFNAETTGIITANTFSGILTASSGYIGTATLRNIDSTGISTIADLRLTNLTQNTGIATFAEIDGTYGNFDKLDVGVGTAKQFTVKDTDSNTTLRVNNDNTSVISIGKSEPGGNQSGEIRYNNSDTTLQIINYDIGGIDVTLHEGTAGVDTGGFRVKYNNTILTNTTYDGRFSINRDEPEEGYRLDVRGQSRLEGTRVVGVLTVTNGAGNQYELNPLNPPLLQGSNFNISSGISTLNTLRVIGTITPQHIDLDNFGTLDLGWTKYSNSVIGIGSTALAIGYQDADPNPNDKYEVTFNRSDVFIEGALQSETIDAKGGQIFIHTSYTAAGSSGTHFSGNIDNFINNRHTLLGITTVRGNLIIGDPQNGDFGQDVRLGVTTSVISGNTFNALFVKGGTYIGIGTTNVGEFHTPGYPMVIKQTNILIDKETVSTYTGKLQLRRPEFESDKTASGKIASEREEADPRGSTGSRPANIPYFSYGKNIDVDTTTTTMIFDGSLAFVPVPGKNDGSTRDTTQSWSGGILPDYTGRTTDPNTGDTNNTRLTMVGINTYIPRCLLDLGASSPSMNSYMILPTLTQTDINIVKNLWDDNVYDTNQAGHDNAKRLTPDGVPGGALVYNSTTDQIQVRDTASSFRNLNPVVAFGRVSGAILLYGFNATSSGNNTVGPDTIRITFNTPLPNANYTVIYNYENTSIISGTHGGNLVHSITVQQPGYFDITWGDITNLVWHFTVLHV